MKYKKKTINIESKAILDIYHLKDEPSELSVFQDIEKEYRKLVTFFGFELTRKITIQLVYTRKEMDEHWGQKSTVSAMVDAKNPYLIYIFSPLVFEKLTKQKLSAMMPVIVHEIAHTFVTMINKRCFSWMNEGLCEYLSEGALKKVAIQKGNWFWFKENNVLRNPDMSWREIKNHQGYAIAHTLVSYIISTQGKNTIFELLKIKRVRDKSIEQKINSALNVSFEKFLAGFENKKTLQ